LAGVAPLFQAIKYRPYSRGEAQLNGERLHRTNAWQMVRRRAKAAGLTTEASNRAFRRHHRLPRERRYFGEGAPDGAHASTRTTQLYDRREDRVTLDEVVKINIRG
jgi:integrase/recombinase XerD